MILTALTPDFFMLRSRALSNGIATSTVGIPYSMSISSIGGGSWICQLPLFMLTQPRKALRDTVSLQALTRENRSGGSHLEDWRCCHCHRFNSIKSRAWGVRQPPSAWQNATATLDRRDRKSTRLNSSHAN